jgi:ribosomal protein L11 methyltransferase
MRWIEAKVYVEAERPLPVMEVVADMFIELETKGVAIEEPWTEPLEGWDPDASAPPDYYAVSGYFPETPRTENRIRLLEERLSGLKVEGKVDARVVYKTIDEEDWSNSWKKYFKPKKIGDRIVVKPTWRDYEAGPGEIVLEIDPGMAFGTGTHPTTANCVRLLEKFVKEGDSFLDVGTGSGILMMAASRLGACKLAGTDRDETAVEIAGKNLELNGLKRERFHLAVADLANGIKGKFDVIAANILSEVIVRLLDSLPDLMAENGVFIASGIIEENLKPVLEKMGKQGLEVVECAVEEKWAAVAARKRTARAGG